MGVILFVEFADSVATFNVSAFQLDSDGKPLLTFGESTFSETTTSIHLAHQVAFQIIP